MKKPVLITTSAVALVALLVGGAVVVQGLTADEPVPEASNSAVEPLAPGLSAPPSAPSDTTPGLSAPPSDTPVPPAPSAPSAPSAPAAPSAPNAAPVEDPDKVAKDDITQISIGQMASLSVSGSVKSSVDEINADPRVGVTVKVRSSQTAIFVGPDAKHYAAVVVSESGRIFMRVDGDAVKEIKVVPTSFDEAVRLG